MNSDEAMRSAMVEGITKLFPLSGKVADALRTVPRHLFVPDASLEEAYTDDTVVTRRDADGVATSSASAPWLVGLMLDQLDLREGQRVLEIGGGTGFNSALIGHLVGSEGHVTAVEIQPDVADDARAALTSAGVTNVEYVTGDGDHGHPTGALYDRIIATAGVWEIPEAWAEQLAPDGILVVPLRMKGLTRALALTRDTDGVLWRSTSAINCGFMPMRGEGEMRERNIQLADDLVVRYDDGVDVDIDALKSAAAGPGEVRWTGALIDAPLDLLDFYLADMAGYCRVLAPPSITNRGLAEPLNGWGSMGAATADSLGYLTKRTSELNPHLWELGVCAYGPAAADTVAELADRVNRWRAAKASVTGIRVEIHPVPNDLDVPEAIMTVDKRHSRVVVWPETGTES